MATAAVSPVKGKNVFKVSELFPGVKAPDSAVIEIPDPLAEAVPYIPKNDPDYQFETNLYKDLMVWLFGGKKAAERRAQKLPSKPRNLFLKGRPGTGKSSGVEQLLNRLKRPCYRLSCHDRLEFEMMVGSFVLATSVPAGGSVAPGVEMSAAEASKSKGVMGALFTRLIMAVLSLGANQPKMVYQYGALARAMKEGAVLLLDEGDGLPPETWTAMHTILDGGPLVIPQTGEIIYPHPDFRIVATGNVGFHGDELGIHKGIKRQNVATSRRFVFIKLDYMSVAEETKLVKRVVPELDDGLIAKMVKFATEVRDMHISSPSQNGSMTGVMSTDVLLRWAELTYDYNGMGSISSPVTHALQRAALDGWTAVDAAAGLEHWTNLVGTA